jgi:hypothetical protein
LFKRKEGGSPVTVEERRWRAFFFGLVPGLKDGEKKKKEKRGGRKKRVRVEVKGEGEGGEKKEEEEEERKETQQRARQEKKARGGRNTQVDKSPSKKASG